MTGDEIFNDATAEDAVTAEFVRAEKYWEHAMRSEPALMSRVFHPNSVVVHHDGRQESGTEYIARLDNGLSPVRGMEVHAGTSISTGQVTVVTSEVDLHIARGDNATSTRVTVTRVWLRTDAGWQILALTASGPV